MPNTSVGTPPGRKVDAAAVGAAACADRALVGNVVLFRNPACKCHKAGMRHHAAIAEAYLHTFFQGALGLVRGGEVIVRGRALQADGQCGTQALRRDFCTAQADFLLRGKRRCNVGTKRFVLQCTQNFHNTGTAKRQSKALPSIKPVASL